MLIKYINIKFSCLDFNGSNGRLLGKFPHPKQNKFNGVVGRRLI